MTWHDGAFWAGAEPLFLSGFNWDATEARQNPALLKRLGVNLVDGSLRGTMNQDGSFNDAQINGQVAYLRQMAEAGFAVDCMLGVGPPPWMLSATPGLAQRNYGNGVNYVFEHPQLVTYREKLLDHIIPLNAAQPSLFAIEPAQRAGLPGTLAADDGRLASLAGAQVRQLGGDQPRLGHQPEVAR